MKTYDYRRLKIDTRDLSQLCALGQDGWHVIAIITEGDTNYALLERSLEVN